MKEEAVAARQDGFLSKAVIHPKHVDVVNAAFMPTEEEIAWSQKIIKAFEDNPNSGVVKHRRQDDRQAASSRGGEDFGVGRPVTNGP